MLTSPLISIVVPCYNQAQYMDECLQSVLDQTYSNWECIIVNDGSSDNTEEVALTWTTKDPRFRYIKKENEGVAAARNTGIAEAKGEWILPLDGDDKIHKDYLFLALPKIEQGYNIIYCEAEFFGSTCAPWHLDEYSYIRIMHDNVIFNSAIYHKKDWIACGGYDKNLRHGYEDWDFWLSITHKDTKVFRIPKTLFYYRRKTVSRDTLVNQDETKKNMSYNYIFYKHSNRFIPQKNAINEFFRLKKVEEEYTVVKQQLYKNKLTRFLLKIIKLI